MSPGIFSLLGRCFRTDVVPCKFQTHRQLGCSYQRLGRDDKVSETTMIASLRHVPRHARNGHRSLMRRDNRMPGHCH